MFIVIDPGYRPTELWDEHKNIGQIIPDGFRLFQLVDVVHILV